MKLETCKTCASHSFTYTNNGKRCNYCGNEYTLDLSEPISYGVRDATIGIFKGGKPVNEGQYNLRNANHFWNGKCIGQGLWLFKNVFSGQYELCNGNEFKQRINIL